MLGQATDQPTKTAQPSTSACSWTSGRVMLDATAFENHNRPEVPPYRVPSEPMRIDDRIR